MDAGANELISVSVLFCILFLIVAMIVLPCVSLFVSVISQVSQKLKRTMYVSCRNRKSGLYFLIRTITCLQFFENLLIFKVKIFN